MANEKGKITRKILKYTGRIFSVYNEDITTPDGLSINRDVVEHKPAVAILAKYQGKYVVSHEYRSGVNKETYGIPAGLIEAGENPLKAAFRELKEETGLVGKTAQKLTTMTSSEGFTDETTTLVYIEVDHDSHEVNFDKDELVHHQLVTKHQLIQMQQKSQIQSYPGVVASLYLNNNLI